MNPHIYILHGWAIDQFNDKKWQPFMQKLKQAGIDSTFFKLPGLSAPLDKVWELDDYINWIDQHLPPKPNIILGHSFGGQLAIRYTHLHPDKVDKLILVDSAGIIDKRLKKVIKRNVFKIIAKAGKPFFKAPIFRKVLYKLAREGDYKNAPPLMRKVMSNVINQEVIKEASTLNKQTLILWGKNDQITPLFMGEKYHSLIKQSILKIIKDARHSPPFTHADQVVTNIKAFLSNE